MKKMRFLIFSTLIFFLSAGCNSDEKQLPKVVSADSSAIKKDTTIGKPFFDFDEVIHYNIGITYNEFDDLDRKGPKTEYEHKLWDVLTSLNPYDIQGVEFWNDLYDIKKDERLIKEKYFKQLRSEVFVEKKCDEIYASACIPVFRDILVFKKANKIKGVAKICFKCRMYNFQATSANVDCFGMNGEYETLKELLEQNNKY